MRKVIRKRVRREDLPALMDRVRRATFVAFVAATVPTLRKTGRDASICPWWTQYKAGRLVKVANPRGMIYWRYINSVNNARLRSGLDADFEPKPRQWGHRIEGSALVEHTTKGGDYRLYVELKVAGSGPYHYELDGQPLAREEVEVYLPQRKDPAEGQGLPTGKGVWVRDYGLGSLREIRCTFPKVDGGKRKHREQWTVVD